MSTKTIREMYCKPIEAAKTDDEIRAAYEAMITETEDYLTNNPDPENETDAKKLVNGNLGYMLGYYDQETRERWYRVLDSVSHPVFGHTFGRGSDPTPKEAFEAGVAAGEAPDEH